MHRQVQKRHARKTQALRQLAGLGDQLGAGLDAVDVAGGFLAAVRNIEKQVIQNETQIRLAGTMVGQAGRGLAGKGVVQQRLDELVQVVDLLELAPRVLVELALPREDVQLLEQVNRLAGAQLFNHLGRGRGFELEGFGHALLSLTPGFGCSATIGA